MPGDLTPQPSACDFGPVRQALGCSAIMADCPHRACGSAFSLDGLTLDMEEEDLGSQASGESVSFAGSSLQMFVVRERR